MRIRTLYLSTPALRLPHGEALIAQAKAMCQAAGFEPLTAEPGDLTERRPSEAMAREIYAARIARQRKADAAIVDLTPFRGPHCDPTAAFEAGFFAGENKPVFAYLNIGEEDDAELSARVDAYVGAEADAEGVWRDTHGAEVEDFGLPETLMLWAEARRLYVVVTPDPQHDLTGLQLCLDAVKLYAD